MLRFTYNLSKSETGRSRTLQGLIQPRPNGWLVFLDLFERQGLTEASSNHSTILLVPEQAIPKELRQAGESDRIADAILNYILHRARLSLFQTGESEKSQPSARSERSKAPDADRESETPSTNQVPVDWTGFGSEFGDATAPSPQVMRAGVSVVMAVNLLAGIGSLVEPLGNLTSAAIDAEEATAIAPQTRQAPQEVKVAIAPEGSSTPEFLRNANAPKLSGLNFPG